MMQHKPILFSTPMVRAILDGRKTQTRRVVKGVARNNCIVTRKATKTKCGIEKHVIDCLDMCPYGQPGDVLWVRENGWERPYRTEHMMREGADTWHAYYYDTDIEFKEEAEQLKDWGFKRRPSIHMPRWASRLVLEIVDIRVELLRNISPEDKAAEGGTPDMPFGTVWRKINTAPGIRWEDNPWVWVIEFKAHQQNIQSFIQQEAA